jgi:chromosome partitioning protein
MTVISLFSTKGGCGKSTAAVHLCRWLSTGGATVALVDTDSQKTSTEWVSCLKPNIPRPKLYHITNPDSIFDRLKKDIAEKHGAVVVDVAGGLTEVQRAVLLLSDLVLIPIQPTEPDLLAAQNTIKAINRSRQVNSNLEAYVFLSRVEPNTILRKKARTALSLLQDISLLQSKIHQRQIMANLMAQGATAFDVQEDAGVMIARQYNKLFQEVLEFDYE